MFDKESLDHNNYQRIQEEMIGPVPIQSLNRTYNLQPIDLKEFSNKNKILINSYDICSDLIYISQIYYIENKMEPYTISIFFGQRTEAVLNIGPAIFSELDKMNFFNEKDLGNVIETLEKEISNMMSRLISMEDPIFRRRTIRYLATNYVKIDEIFPLLLDNYIEEIFMDSIDDYIYINHQVYGRCRTLIQVRLETVNALKTHIRLESRERLDREHSSIVFVIQNKFFHCRFSIDVAPIHAENLCLDIRKVNKRTFTLIDLIINNTITVEIAAFLYFCIRRRINVTVVGKPILEKPR